MWQLVVLCNKILIKVVGFPIKLYRNEKEYLCNLYYFFRDSSCSIVIYNISQTYVMKPIDTGMYADDPVYKALDRSNTKIQVNMNK